MRSILCLIVASAALSTLGAPAAIAAQAQPPAGMAQVEMARSRDCVRPLSDLEALNQAMQPFMDRMDLLDSIRAAVAIEDSSIVSRLRLSDPVEAAVKKWFETDHALALRIVATNSDSLRAVRLAHRDSVKALLGRAMTATQTAARAKADSLHAQKTEQAAGPCVGMVFVRSAVREACRGVSSQLCRIAAADSSKRNDPYQFVDSASDLWGIQQFLPWTDPAPVSVGPGGVLTGATTQTSARQGNIEISVGVQPVLHSTKGLDSAQVAGSRALVDSLGFTWDIPKIVMTPALVIQSNLTEPIAGETTYVLHFGTFADSDIVWSGPAGTGKPTDAVIPLVPTVLKKLEAGAALEFSALDVPKTKGAKAKQVFGIGLVQVNESNAVTSLAQYLSKQLDEDVKKLSAGTKSSG